MDRIVLEVDDAAAATYHGFSAENKQGFCFDVSLMLKKVANDSAFAEHSKHLDKLGDEATKNGLTPEILESLLASDD